MNDVIATGNALQDGGGERRGWFIGHFADPSDGLKSTSAVEVKWGVHARGEQKSALAHNLRAATLSVLVSGAFQVDFPDQGQSITLRAPGDYVLFAPGVPHRWTALEDTVILSVRWPSLPGDQQPADSI